MSVYLFIPINELELWNLKAEGTTRLRNVGLADHMPSGQSRVYRVTQLRTDGVDCREPAGTGPVNLKVVPVTGVALHLTMDQICLSFPHPLLARSKNVKSTVYLLLVPRVRSTIRNLSRLS